MTAYLSPLYGAGAQLMDNNGSLLAGGKIYTYQAGSSVPYNTWTTIGQTVLNANPIILDASGRVSNQIWLAQSVAYKFVVTDSLNNVISTWDNLYPFGVATLNGDPSQTFEVAPATTATQAVQLQQLKSIGSIAFNATTTPLWTTDNPVLNISGTGTMTAIPACATAQVGSVKTVIPTDAAGFSITATANIVVDGATSGTYLMPKNANIQVIATSTTTFKVSIISSKLGSEQTWLGYSIGVNRSAGVTYTNDAGRAIEIIISGGVGVDLSVGGVVVSSMQSTRCSVSAIVPAGVTYNIAVSGTLIYWEELR